MTAQKGTGKGAKGKGPKGKPEGAERNAGKGNPENRRTGTNSVGDREVRPNRLLASKVHCIIFMVFTSRVLRYGIYQSRMLATSRTSELSMYKLAPTLRVKYKLDRIHRLTAFRNVKE